MESTLSLVGEVMLHGVELVGVTMLAVGTSVPRGPFELVCVLPSPGVAVTSIPRF